MCRGSTLLDLMTSFAFDQRDPQPVARARRVGEPDLAPALGHGQRIQYTAGSGPRLGSYGQSVNTQLVRRHNLASRRGHAGTCGTRGSVASARGTCQARRSDPERDRLEQPAGADRPADAARAAYPHVAQSTERPRFVAWVATAATESTMSLASTFGRSGAIPRRVRTRHTRGLRRPAPCQSTWGLDLGPTPSCTVPRR